MATLVPGISKSLGMISPTITREAFVSYVSHVVVHRVLKVEP